VVLTGTETENPLWQLVKRQEIRDEKILKETKREKERMKDNQKKKNGKKF
jgi:hypothetical protein